MTAVLALIALVAIVLLWQKLMSAGSKAVNQKVLRKGSHQRGQDAVHTGITFCPTHTAAEATAGVRSALNLPSSGSGVSHKPYLGSAGPTWLKISIGNRPATGAEMLFSAADEANGCEGLLVVKSWSESDGIVTTIDEIDSVRTQVEEALRAMAAGVQIQQQRV